MNEIWKDIKGYEGFYQVSNIGRIKSLSRLKQIRKGRFFKSSDRILIPKNNGAGYLKIDLSKDGIHSQRYVHRLVAEYFIKQPAEKTKVNHIDGNRSNNNYNNLEWCTPKENSAHARNVLNRYGVGESHQMAKLTTQSVLEIRRIKSSGSSSSKDLSIKYGVSKEHINAIARKITWKEI